MSKEQSTINGNKIMSNNNSQTVKNFGQELLAKGQLNCSHCHGLLCTPIILVDGGVGNVCKKCFEAMKEKSSVELRGIPNNLLDEFIKNLELPCKYQLSGCKNITPYKDKFTHDKSCVYQPHDCLLSHSCVWRGSALHLVDHFIGKHGTHVVEVAINKFNFQLPLHNCHQPFVKLLKNINVCLFFVATAKNDHLFYTIFDCKGNDQPPCEYVEIAHIGQNGKFSVECKVGTLQEHIKSSLLETKVNQPLLTQFTVEDGSVSVQVKNVSSNICIVGKKIVKKSLF